MPEAVIVSAARSPIGRANKGSLKDFRPDDLAAHDRPGRAGQGARRSTRTPSTTSTSAAACPAARAATTWAGSSTCSTAWTRCPAPRSPATAPRRCRPPGWPSTRSRPARATSSSPPASRRCRGSPRAPPTTGPTPTTRCSTTPRPAPRRPPRAASDWHDPREDGDLPDVYIAMGQTAENLARLRGLDREELDEFGVRSQNLAEKAIADGFWAREITPVTTPDGTVVSSDDGPRAGVTFEAISQLKPVFRPDGVVTAGNCCAAQRRRRRGRDHVRHQGRRARPHPAGPDRLHRRQRPVPRDHGPRPGRGDQARAGARRHDASATSTWSRSTRRSPRRWCRPTRTSASTSTGSTSTAARSRSATRSA